MYNGKVSTTFAPAENSTFALNGWFMHTQSQLHRIYTSESHDNCIYMYYNYYNNNYYVYSVTSMHVCMYVLCM